MKHFSRRRKVLFLAGGFALAMVSPFLIPIPPLRGTVPAHDLADGDSDFVNINGLEIHIRKMGQGEPVFLMLHGFASSLYTWHAIMDSLSHIGTVIAYDRPGFGLSERPLTWHGQNPYSAAAQVDLAASILNYYGVQQVVVMGNSAGGAIAMQMALDQPERVSALILVDPAVYHGGNIPGWLKVLLKTPQMRYLGLFAARQVLSRGRGMINLAWHDPGRITPEIQENYLKPFKVANWDKSLWEFTLASRPIGLAHRLGEVDLPCLIITGDDDRIVPARDSLRLSRGIPNSQIAIIENAGHVPHEEQPGLFLEAVFRFLNNFLPQEESHVKGDFKFSSP